MEGKTDKIISCKNEKVSGSQLVKNENKNLDSGKKEEKTKKTELKSNTINETKNQNSDKSFKNDSNKVLKRKVTEDGVVIERVLSDGETSSGFETVSSIDSKVDIYDLDLSSSIEDFDDEDCNIIVKIKNEMAFQNKNRPDERYSYNETRSKSSGWQNNKTNSFTNNYSNRRNNALGGFKESKHQQRNNVVKNYNYDRRDRESSERKNFDHSRQRSCNKDWSTYKDQSRRTRRDRWDEFEVRSRRSRSYERSDRFRESRSLERIVRVRSPSYKDTRSEFRHSGSFDKNSSNSSSERYSPPRKRSRNSQSRSSSSSIWKRLDSRRSPDRVKKDDINNDKRNQKNSFDSPYRKKERTPFLVELERKLKEVDSTKNVKQELMESTVSGNAPTSVPPMPQPVDENRNPSLPLPYMTSLSCFQGSVYPVPYPPMPAVSVNNLPLVPGPTGLPIHVMSTGEQIPHDVDGRPIPVGPNGYYLPLDPTGRIFPHIVSPENQAVPIHISEDGVLRLPNLEPVPYGPEHQLPVNIDGRVIPIGPDSKPLYPCPNLPKKPPPTFLEMVGSNGGKHVEKTMANTTPTLPSAQTEAKEIPKKTIETQTENMVHIQSPVVDLGLLNLIQDPAEVINKAELLNKYKKKAREKNEDVLKCAEIEKNLGNNPSKRGVKRSVPMKLCQKKISRDDTSSSGSDMILDSGDSNSSPALKITMESETDSIGENLFNSDDDKNILRFICDKGVPKEPNTEANFEDYITEKIKRALRLLNEKNHVPPIVGRFIISNVNSLPSLHNSPNESPLLRNRIQLPFINSKSILQDQQDTLEEPEVTFKFLPQEKDFQKREKNVVSNLKNSKFTPMPVFTFDFAMQCDFTSDKIRNLNLEVSKLEEEVSRLKRINSSLFDKFRNAQTAKQKKTEELKKALLEIQDMKKEIRSLKHSRETSK